MENFDSLTYFEKVTYAFQNMQLVICVIGAFASFAAFAVFSRKRFHNNSLLLRQGNGHLRRLRAHQLDQTLDCRHCQRQPGHTLIRSLQDRRVLGVQRCLHLRLALGSHRFRSHAHHCFPQSISNAKRNATFSSR